MRYFLYITMILFFLSGCKPGIPGDIIQPDEMAKVLHDIHIADSYLGMNTRPDSVKIKAAEYYKGIYKKYDIDSVMYNKSMDYYYKQPKVLNDIYIKVTSVLTKEKDGIIKADSIINAKEIAKIRMKFVRDSTRTADSTFWADFLLKDTTSLKMDTVLSKNAGLLSKKTMALKKSILAGKRDTTKLKLELAKLKEDSVKLKLDSVKKKIDVMNLKMDYKSLKDLK